MQDSEKIYKRIAIVGSCSIVTGIIMIVVGLSVGILNIVQGGLLLKGKSKIMF
ncbi:MAG: hypothetical protein ACI4F9_02540 [Lachnospiraceae bacterium]